MKINGNLADHSGAITMAGVSQLVAPASPGRSYLLFEALTADMWINFGKPASPGAGSMFVPQGTSLQWSADEFVPTEALYAWCETGGGGSSNPSESSSSNSSASSTPQSSSSSSTIPPVSSSSSSSGEPSSSETSESSSSSSGCPVDCCCVEQLDVTFEQTIACHTVSVPTAFISGYPGYIADRTPACAGELSASALLGILWDCESKTGISANYGTFECRLYQTDGVDPCGTLLATFTGTYYAYITCDLVNGWTVEIRVVPDQEDHPETGHAVVISGKFTAQSGVTFDPTRGLGSAGVVGDTGSATITPCIDCPQASSSSSE